MSYTGQLNSDQVLVGPSTGGSATVASPLGFSSGVISGYKTVLDVDFAALGAASPQTLTSPAGASPGYTVYSIGGFSWLKPYTGVVAERAAPTLNSSGLTFYPSQSVVTDWTASLFNFPRVHLNLSNVPGISQIGLTGRMRVWVYGTIAGAGVVTSGDGLISQGSGNLCFGISSATTINLYVLQTFFESYGVSVKRGHHTDPQGELQYTDVHKVEANIIRPTDSAISSLVYTFDDVLRDQLVLDVDTILPRRAHLRTSGYAWGGSWPLLSDLAEACDLEHNLTLGTQFNSYGLSRWVLTLGGAWTSSLRLGVQTSTMTFKRVRIDVRP